MDYLKNLQEWLITEGSKAYEESHPIFDSNVLVDDLKNTPHAFVIGCVLDRQIKAEKAWAIPEALKARIGSFDFNKLTKITEQEWEKYFTEPTKLHRFNSDMAKNVYADVQRINKKYDGVASNIWANNPSSATVIKRFLEFDGIGQKISTMAANILVRDFKVPFSDHRWIDISVDVHVGRVLTRMGLVEKNNVDVVVFYAREANPECPGVFDFIIYEIGKNYCFASDPDCENCPASKQGCMKII